MLREKKYHFFLLVLLFSCCTLGAQQPDVRTDEPVVNKTAGIPVDTLSPAGHGSEVIVGDIVLSGNKKTRDIIILREIPFRSGEAYPLDVLVKKFGIARRQLMNTALFNMVVVAAGTIEGDRVNVTVIVKERWYLFPLPFFRPVDRNLNQWLVEQNGSLDRVNYGAKLYYNNATGSNDKLRLGLTNGYTKQVSLSYDRLYIDNQLKWGMKVTFATGKNRELNYNTVNDKQVFLKDENNYVRNFTSASLELTYRRAIKTRHSFGVGFITEQVMDTIVALNPSYFKSGRNRISFPGFYYNMTWFDLDYIPYPTKGYAAQLSVGKSGLNNIINIWQLHAKGSATWPLSPQYFFNLNMYGGVKLPFKQPYFNQRFLGYGDVFMQGYEYFVIDGVAGGYLKTTLTRKLLNFNIKVPPRKKGKDPDIIPVRIFGKVFGNAGYVHNPQPGNNSLSNKMLYSGGFGIDILTFYDVTFKLEWTFNSLGQNGIFLHRKTIF